MQTTTNNTLANGQPKYRVLMMGASYGSLLGLKLLMAGHDVVFVCRDETAALINRDGIRVRIPERGTKRLVDVHSQGLPGRATAVTPEAVDLRGIDMVGLAMQEPQYSQTGVQALMQRIGEAAIPCLSIMNMPPLPYLARIPSLNIQALRDCYDDASVWDSFKPEKVTLCSPDPQAFRPPEEPNNVLEVALPTNFKAARFVEQSDNAMLTQMMSDIEAVRFNDGGKAIELPVKLKVFESIFVPLAKWSMLLTGNYRCIQEDEAQSIRTAVHVDLAQSEEIYQWVDGLAQRLGANPADAVPFEKYAKAATGLAKPSSAARAVDAGKTAIERVDKLVQLIARSQGVSTLLIDQTVALVDAKLEANRQPGATTLAA